MDYTELEIGIKYFEDKWPPDRDWEYKYSKLRLRDIGEPGYWLHLEKMDVQRLGKEIIDGFLNQWGSRIPTNTFETWYQASYNLKQAVDQLPEYYTSLASFRIEDVDFQDCVTLKGKEASIWNVIDSIYSIFLQIKSKFGPVPASKLMHMAIPNLFVMWDHGIIQRHCIPVEKLPGVKGKPRSYIAFLILMQENIRHVIKSYPRASELTVPEVVQRIQAEHNNLSLPRLLDMSNMAVRDCEQTICLACMKRAKARWGKLGLVPDYSSSE
jgi:hypothetical protein